MIIEHQFSDTSVGVQEIIRIQRVGQRVLAFYKCRQCGKEYTMQGRAPYTTKCKECR